MHTARALSTAAASLDRYCIVPWGLRPVLHCVCTTPAAATGFSRSAGDRVVTDPLCKPFSMGRNLFCVHSRKRLDDIPELKSAKVQQNRRTLITMASKFQQVRPSQACCHNRRSCDVLYADGVGDCSLHARLGLTHFATIAARDGSGSCRRVF